jgi:hypothetical protein
MAQQGRAGGMSNKGRKQHDRLVELGELALGLGVHAHLVEHEIIHNILQQGRRNEHEMNEAEKQR